MDHVMPLTSTRVLPPIQLMRWKTLIVRRWEIISKLSYNIGSTTLTTLQSLSVCTILCVCSTTFAQVFVVFLYRYVSICIVNMSFSDWTTKGVKGYERQCEIHRKESAILHVVWGCERHVLWHPSLLDGMWVNKNVFLTILWLKSNVWEY